MTGADRAAAAPAIVVLGPGGLAIGRRIANLLANARVFGLARRVDGADIAFDDAGEQIRALFSAGRPVIGVCATAILIRALAALLADKRVEPPVVAVAEDGSAVVPLIGGHRGANDLARRIAAELGVAPAVTTASDVVLGVALDEPPEGWVLANPGDAGNFAAALLAGAAVRSNGDEVPPFIERAGIRRSGAGALRITTTVRAMPGGTGHLVYHPRALAVGVGCERGADPAELMELVGRTLEDAGLARHAVAGLFSLDLKMDEPAVHAAAGMLGTEARFFDAAALEAETPRLVTPSEIVFREVGCHGVAEGAALAAAGPAGTLVVAKKKSCRTTCAVARAPQPLDAALAGCPRGRLLVVGLGPGSGGWMTAESEAAIAAASDLVGYTLYLDLLGPRASGKACHGFALGEEAARAREALDLAAAGRTVALVSSGDPGIYAMASLVLELMDAEDRPDWRRAALEICPGVSALQAAAARAGAPLGHDFCAISLSDLLTPWSVIERRLRAAADGDFVVALYNPASRSRAGHLARAREVLLGARAASTPVVVARNLGRDGESVRTTTLGDLDPAAADMLTTVLVGSSHTRAVGRNDGGRWIYTPRGYLSGAETEGMGQ